MWLKGRLFIFGNLFCYKYKQKGRQKKNPQNSIFKNMSGIEMLCSDGGSHFSFSCTILMARHPELGLQSETSCGEQ